MDLHNWRDASRCTRCDEHFEPVSAHQCTGENHAVNRAQHFIGKVMVIWYCTSNEDVSAGCKYSIQDHMHDVAWRECKVE